MPRTKVKPFRIYMSHPIRGPKREKATDADMQKNNKRAHDVAEQLRAYFLDWQRMDGFVPIEIYVPGENDEFIIHAYRRGYLTEDQILDCDCDIISTCDMVLALGDYTSNGMKVEIDFATAEDIPVFRFSRVQKTVVRNLYTIIETIMIGS